MMGRQETKRELFVLISLNEYVPQDHLLRAVDQYLDLSEFRENLAPSYSHTGRPSVDPELMARMLIIGYCYGIRSERRLCEEVGMNLAYRWFCRLGLKDKVPDHSSFSKNRHGRFRDHDAFRQLFDSVLRRCMAEGLVQGEGFAIDASMINSAKTEGDTSDALSEPSNATTYNFPVHLLHCDRSCSSVFQHNSPVADLRSKSKGRTSFRYCSKTKKRTRNESLKQAIQEDPLASQQKTAGAPITNLHSIPHAVEADHCYVT